MAIMPPKGWSCRYYLPHFDGESVSQFVTFHLADCFSTALLRGWQEKLSFIQTLAQKSEHDRLVNRYLDKGSGQAWLRDSLLATMVEDALLFFNAERYALHAWVVMPNHVHALFTPFAGNRIKLILHSWKSFTSHEAVRDPRIHEPFWSPDSYDRFIRNDQHYANVLAYIENNPVKAGLCNTPTEYRWSSAWWREYAGD